MERARHDQVALLVAILLRPGMAQHAFRLNGREVEVEAPAEMPLLWVLRDVLGLMGTKYGCGIAQCGACTVHIDGRATRSCRRTVGAVAGHEVTTIEGLSREGGHALQRAWIAEDVPQCGYCQSGQIMSAAALIARTPRPTDEELAQAMRGNLCRCGTYARIRRAIRRVAPLPMIAEDAGVPTRDGAPEPASAEDAGAEATRDE